MKKVLGLMIALALLFAGALCVHAQQEDTLTLRYDDRKDLSQLLGTEATQVQITDQQPTSCQVGTQTPDTDVLYYDPDTGILYAVGTGTATLTVDGASYAVTVEAAPLSLFMYTGHSVGHGAEGTATQSVVVEAGQAYSSYDPKSLDLTQIDGYGLGWGAENRVGNATVSVSGSGNGHIDAFGSGMKGTRGSGSALAYEWNRLTGEKVWVINVAVGGSCLNEWMPGAEGHSTTYSDYYYTAVNMFSYAQTIIANEVAAGHYTLSHMGILYYCGANQSNYPDWSFATIEQNYETLLNGFKSDLTTQIGGTERTIDFVGLVPYWTEGNRNSLAFDKPAAFYMASSEAYPDVFLASNEYRSFMTVEGLAGFPAITYTTQSAAVTVPTSVTYSATESCVMADDAAHPTQVVYNAIGMDTADNIYAWLQGNNAAPTAIAW